MVSFIKDRTTEQTYPKIRDHLHDARRFCSSPIITNFGQRRVRAHAKALSLAAEEGIFLAGIFEHVRTFPYPLPVTTVTADARHPLEMSSAPTDALLAEASALSASSLLEERRSLCHSSRCSSSCV